MTPAVDAPQYIGGIFILLTGFVFLSLMYGLNHGLGKLGLNHGRKKKTLLSTCTLLAGWLALTGILSWNEFFLDFDSLPPKVGLAILPPIIVSIILSFNSGVQRVAEAISGRLIVSLQSFRILVEALLWLLFINGALPEIMTFHGRNFDILVGLSAPVIAYFCFREGRPAPRLLAVWNIAALLLLINVVSHGILSAPTPFRLFFTDPPNIVLLQFPYVWLPSFLIPTALFLTLLTFRYTKIMKQTLKRP